MAEYKTEQRVKIIQAYYENGKSRKNTLCALREYFGVQNRPSERTVWNLAKTFEQTGFVSNAKAPQHTSRGSSEQNIANVRENVTEKPRTSIRH
ncbi:hypothetical protein ILUMI_22649 [Ignelater luminosus]|uniref:DUF4817 domain-containing protein n=1 Tax=Ignelater luminosus TaxID=2038154 RepID=A0A8K0CFF4_IGNLU|nr:hypothetical protein ILUMI_22649 [Ignelater luminosus]